MKDDVSKKIALKLRLKDEVPRKIAQKSRLKDEVTRKIALKSKLKDEVSRKIVREYQVPMILMLEVRGATSNMSDIFVKMTHAKALEEWYKQEQKSTALT